MIKEKLKEKYGNEQVFVLPYEKFKKYNFEDKFQLMLEKQDKSYDFLNQLEEGGLFIFRSDAEYNRAFVQIIPYILIVNENKKLVYAARRKAGDERLIGKWSFFGGHINPVDNKKMLNLIINATIREESEELNLNYYKNSVHYLIGTVQDTMSSTGEHLGIVLYINVKEAQIKETDTLEGKWFSLNELYNHYNEFENWAKYIIDKIYETKGNIIFPEEKRKK